MKTFFLLILGILFSSSSFSQTYNCSSTVFTVSNIICDDKNNDDPADDMIQFIVTGENGSSSESISGWDELPMVINASPYNGINFDEQNSKINFYFGNAAYNVTFAVNSTGCLPLSLVVSLGNNCPDEPLDLNPNGITVPTLGQWGLIILSILIIILGLSKIRQTYKTFGLSQ